MIKPHFPPLTPHEEPTLSQRTRLLAFYFLNNQFKPQGMKVGNSSVYKSNSLATSWLTLTVLNTV